MKKTLLTLTAIILSLNTNAATTNLQENQTSVQVSAQTINKIKPDMFESMIQFKEDGFDSAQIQLNINKKIENAKKILEKSSLKYRIKSFSSYKQHNSNKYSASQSILITSKNKQDLAKAITTLQQQEATVTSTGSYLSEELKEKQFEELFAQAYKKLIQKADFITSQINQGQYHIQNLSYHFNEGRISPFMAKSASLSVKENAPQVQFDNEEQNLELSITANIIIKN